MLAPSTLPGQFAEWNRREGAPFGRVSRGERILGRLGGGVRRRGAFAWQGNSTTRRFEFPWAYHEVTSQGREQDILEIGGGLSGLQFVLAREGHHVTNLDPGVTPPESAKHGSDWSIDASQHQALSRALRAPVQLISTSIADAALVDDSFDVVMSVSAIEHFTDDSYDELVRHLARVMRPGGLAIFTLDLFLDIAPFTSAKSNRYGRNFNVCSFLSRSGLRLETGERSQLFGFPEFDTDRVQCDLSSFMMHTAYPVLSQCFTARVAVPAD